MKTSSSANAEETHSACFITFFSRAGNKETLLQSCSKCKFYLQNVKSAVLNHVLEYQQQVVLSQFMTVQSTWTDVSLKYHRKPYGYIHCILIKIKNTYTYTNSIV